MIFVANEVEAYELERFLYEIYGIGESTKDYMVPGINEEIIRKVLKSYEAEMSFDYTNNYRSMFKVTLDKKFSYKHEIRFIDDLHIVKRLLKSKLIAGNEINMENINLASKNNMFIKLKKTDNNWNVYVGMKFEKEIVGSNVYFARN